MEILPGKSQLSEVILLSSLPFDEVPTHQKSTLGNIPLYSNI